MASDGASSASRAVPDARPCAGSMTPAWAPMRAPRPTVSEWLLLEERGVVSRSELRQLLELATPVQVSQSVTSGAELLPTADPP